MSALDLLPAWLSLFGQSSEITTDSIAKRCDEMAANIADSPAETLPDVRALIDIAIKRLGGEPEAEIEDGPLSETVVEHLLLSARRSLVSGRYEAFYATAGPWMVHSTEPTGRIVAVTQKWCDELGYYPPMVLGRPLIEFLTEDSRRFASEEAMPNFWRAGHIENVQYAMVRSDGSVIDVLVSATAQRDKEGRYNRSVAIVQPI